MDSGGELEQQQPRAAKRTRRASSSRRDLYQQLDGDGARASPPTVTVQNGGDGSGRVLHSRVA